MHRCVRRIDAGACGSHLESQKRGGFACRRPAGRSPEPQRVPRKGASGARLPPSRAPFLFGARVFSPLSPPAICWSANCFVAKQFARRAFAFEANVWAQVLGDRRRQVLPRSGGVFVLQRTPHTWPSLSSPGTSIRSDSASISSSESLAS